MQEGKVLALQSKSAAELCVHAILMCCGSCHTLHAGTDGSGAEPSRAPPLHPGLHHCPPLLISLGQGHHCNSFMELEGEGNHKFAHKMKDALFILDPLKNPQLLARRVTQQAVFLKMLWAFSNILSSTK